LAAEEARMRPEAQVRPAVRRAKRHRAEAEPLPRTQAGQPLTAALRPEVLRSSVVPQQPAGRRRSAAGRAPLPCRVAAATSRLCLDRRVARWQARLLVSCCGYVGGKTPE